MAIPAEGLLDPLPWLVVLPLAWAGLAFVLGPGRGASAAILGLAGQAALAILLAAEVSSAGPRTYSVGGWGAPLGIDLAADGLSAAMVVLAQGVALPVALYARGYFSPDAAPARYFWPLTGFLLAGLNGLFLSADLFNLYVTLELVGLSAVGLVAAGSGGGQMAAALRYLFATLVASGAYFLGVALIYGAYGTVSLATLGSSVTENAPTAVRLAGVLMVLGLMVKTALFPFHYWLPPAHGGAPAPVSALLSALVVKASFYLVLRLWLGPLDVLAADFAWLPGLLGSAAILWGSAMAIQARRLKMLVAYSTVAQLGYLFLIFPLLAPGGPALQAGILQVFAHGLAKAGMFCAAGVLILATGRDMVDEIVGVASRQPLTLFAFALAGVTLMGLPPSGGFLAKWLLLDAALARGRWDLAAVVIAGGLLAAVYVFRVLRQAFLLAPAMGPHRRPSAVMEWMAFALAAASVLLGFGGMGLVGLLDKGAGP